MMKKIFFLLLAVASNCGAGSVDSLDMRLNFLETDAKKTIQNFNDMSKNLSIASISESIVSSDANILKGALQDVINLNKMVNSQVNVAIQFWNMYLESIKIPTIDHYLLGHVMNSLIGTIRALSLRSSLDQAMILSFVKKNFSQESKQDQLMSTAVDVKNSTIEDRWKMLRIE